MLAQKAICIGKYRYNRYYVKIEIKENLPGQTKT